MMKNKFVDLKTEFSNDFDKTNPLKEYPRMHLKRDSYLNLNGEWDYIISKDKSLPKDFSHAEKIVVPYCLESSLSGVKRRLKSNEFLYYHLNFSCPKDFKKDIVIFHIDGVDQLSEIYLNGVMVGKTDNGYIPFEFNVTPFFKEGSNNLVIKVQDKLDHKYPYGKQKKNRGGMWYTPVSGIWKSVWLESVTNSYIKDINVTTLDDLTGIHLHVDATVKEKLIAIFFKEKLITQLKTLESDVDIHLDDPKLWSPDVPNLYDLKVTVKGDDVTSYFAMRKVELKNNKVYLNNKEIFLNGVLDQGYFPDGIYTPASYKAYAYDILTMRNLGFNCLRKHIKVEPLYFYYMCDVYGMLVLQDMVNNSNYKFIHDTVLPTVCRGVTFKDHRWNLKHHQIFFDSMTKEVQLLKHYPSIIMWTIYNEGWGQCNADKMHKYLLSLDKTRLIDDTSGWFAQEENMFDSKHIYFIKVDLKPSNKPIFISEFGGYCYRVEDHIFNPTHMYGYKIYKSKEEYQKGFIDLYEEQIIPNKDKLIGTIYTQVSDVEDEVNGLLTYDRKVLKVDTKTVFETMKKLH